MAEVKVKQLDTFLWKGINKRGKASNGEIRAGSVAEAKALLRQQGITPSSVKKKSKPLAFTQPSIKSSDICVVADRSAHPPIDNRCDSRRMVSSAKSREARSD